jgi:hypothetical protein
VGGRSHRRLRRMRHEGRRKDLRPRSLGLPAAPVDWCGEWASDCGASARQAYASSAPGPQPGELARRGWKCESGVRRFAAFSGDTLPTHFRCPTVTTDGACRLALSTIRRPEVQVSSQKLVRTGSGPWRV